MKSLDMLNIGDSATVISISEINSDLKQRFLSFGIAKGSVIKILKKTLANTTIEIDVNSTNLALRFNEAKKIRVE